MAAGLGGGHGGGFGGHGGGFGGYHGYSGGAIGHLHHYGYYNPHAYQSRYLYYPFYGGSYPWYDYQPYYGWSFSSGSDMSEYADGSTLQQPDYSAHITVTLPADAELWFNGTKMTNTGPERNFRSPELTPGRRYTYDVLARWKEHGQEVTQSRKIAVRAGGSVYLEFPLTSGATTRAGAKKAP
jgi:uncharacterized protein (TIGR03000 family)